jgi:RNA polymerase sigma factor (sigma-70 family)
MLMRGKDTGRPSTQAVEQATLRLLARQGTTILATARRYSATPEDAEDAYQRGLEILLAKAPTTREEELVPWLKTVVKHEAFAIRRQRERAAPLTADGELTEPAAGAATVETAERYERLRQGAEALRRLKPQEMRALRLRAEGYSYREIAAITGWTYTKVNRCLTEGRRAFVARLAGIEAGSECERVAPLLSALADGEAGPEALASARAHLRGCLTCRARLREFRAAPARVAALVPPVAAAAGGPVRSLLESVLGAAQHKAAVLGERAHAAAELATGQKVAAVAASAAALAGGGAGVNELAAPDRPPASDSRRVDRARPSAPAPARAPTASTTSPAPPPPPAPRPAPRPTPEPPPAPPDPAIEFVPEGGAPNPSAATPLGGGGTGGPMRSKQGAGEFGP